MAGQVFVYNISRRVSIGPPGSRLTCKRRRPRARPIVQEVESLQPAARE
jgi:hypothetical protein